MLIGQEFKETIRNLRDNGFYQLLVLLIYTRNDKIERALEKTILKGIINEWNDEIINKFTNGLIDNIN